jgi:hypothetical protein
MFGLLCILPLIPFLFVFHFYAHRVLHGHSGFGKGLALRQGRVLDKVDNGEGTTSHAYSMVVLIADIHFPHLLL